MKKDNIIEQDRGFILPEGLRIDLEEGWSKIISRQFGGDPGRGFGELIQNFLDSYDGDVPWPDRRGIITSGKGWVAIRDFGSGLDLRKIRLVTRMGGTDKSSDSSKIGKFGIGFFSIFNPRLGTRKVVITTRCEGEAIQLEFKVTAEGKRPLLSTRVLDQELEFSTEVKVYFDRSSSVQKCIDYARASLQYYPCNITINGKKYRSVWDDARTRQAFFFEKSHCNGFIREGKSYRGSTLLCKYEYILETNLRYLITGGHGLKHTLDDYAGTETPYLPGMEMVVNCPGLNVTISRDGYYLDYHFRNMVSNLNSSLMDLMEKRYPNMSDDLVLSNLYVLRKKIRDYLNGRKDGPEPLEGGRLVFERMVNARVFPMNGRKEACSLVEIKKMLSKGTPLFFSETHNNLRWLGGEFRHDFILSPRQFTGSRSTGHFYDTLLKTLFGDVVNLDTVGSDKTRIRDLIEREIIRKESLEPKCNFIETRGLSEKEDELLRRLEKLLNKKEIQRAIEANIGLPVKRIHPSFFMLKDGGMHISTGLFDENMNPVNDDFISNFLEKQEGADTETRLGMRNTVWLGLCLNHPFVRKLVESQDPHREYYALTYVAHELAGCQRLLSPYSSFYNIAKARLSAGLRKCMIDQMTGAS